MKDIRQRAFVGFIGLAAAGLLSFGCSSSNSSSGTGGSSGHTGGSTGTGGTSSGTGGGSGGGTGTGGSGGGSSCAAATAALITDFTSGGSSQVGTPYKGADTGLTAPTVDTSGSSMVITLATGSPTTQYPYAYAGLPFNACVDASTYKGVKFTASGTLNTGCTIQFSVVDKEHSPAANNGTCTVASCYASSKIFTLPSTPTEVDVLFTDQTGGGADPSAMAVDPTEILNVQWQLNVPHAVDGGTAGGCTGTVTIDDVSFY
jgi:hypothetical protein